MIIIIDYFRKRCIDNTPHNIFIDTCLNCGKSLYEIDNPDTNNKSLMNEYKRLYNMYVVKKNEKNL